MSERQLIQKDGPMFEALIGISYGLQRTQRLADCLRIGIEVSAKLCSHPDLNAVAAVPLKTIKPIANGMEAEFPCALA